MRITSPYFGKYTKKYRSRLLLHAAMFNDRRPVQAVNINDMNAAIAAGQEKADDKEEV